MRQSKAFHSARSLPKGKERAEAFRSLNIQFGFREFDLHSFASKIRQSWIGNHIDSLTAQKIATRAFNAVQRVAFGKARNVRFKGKKQLDSVEGKTNASGIRYKDGFVYWNGLKLQCIINPKDEVHVYGLSHPVKYCRLIKRKLNKRIRFYVQLILEGYPFQKYDFPQNIVGLDIGPSTIAHVSEKHANLETFCNQLENKQKEIRKLQRKLDRQRRANNPNNYNSDGTVTPLETVTVCRSELNKVQVSNGVNPTRDRAARLRSSDALSVRCVPRRLPHREIPDAKDQDVVAIQLRLF